MAVQAALHLTLPQLSTAKGQRGNISLRAPIVAPKLTAEDIKDKGKPTRADFALK